MSTPRLLIVPGLHGSGPGHWQQALLQRHAGAAMIELADWHTPSLAAWQARIAQAVRAEPRVRWLAVGHSFGCLALAHWLACPAPAGVIGALLVAPANPARFGLAPEVLARPLGLPATVVTSRNDPWFDEAGARRMGDAWGAQWVDAGAAGHINIDSGHGPWPAVDGLLQALQRRISSLVGA